MQPAQVIAVIIRGICFLIITPIVIAAIAALIVAAAAVAAVVVAAFCNLPSHVADLSARNEMDHDDV